MRKEVNIDTESNLLEAGLEVNIESTPTFLTIFDDLEEQFLLQEDDVYLEFYNQLNNRTQECDVLLNEVCAF